MSEEEKSGALFSDEEYETNISELNELFDDFKKIYIPKHLSKIKELEDKNSTGQTNKAKLNALNKLEALKKFLPDFGRHLTWEIGFKPKRIKVERGDIVYNKFGWNPGNEIVDDHFAVVIQNNLTDKSGTMVVIPLTSLKVPEDKTREDNVFLGDLGLNTINTKESIARVSQIKVQHKLRVKKDGQKDTAGKSKTLFDSKRPYVCGHLDPDKLDMIDQKIRELLTKEWYTISTVSKQTGVSEERIKEIINHPLYGKLLRVKNEKKVQLLGQESLRIIKEISEWNTIEIMVPEVSKAYV